MPQHGSDNRSGTPDMIAQVRPVHEAKDVATSGRVCVYALTPQGIALGSTLAAALNADLYIPQRLEETFSRTETASYPSPTTLFFPRLADAVGDNFAAYDAHIFIAATGIVIRTIAPHIRRKDIDPAVLVLDQRGRHVISLLSGHLGGANALAERVARLTGGTAVITTATDTENLPSIDTLAAQANLAIANLSAVRHINAAILEGTPVIVDDPHNHLKLSEQLSGIFIPSGSVMAEHASRLPRVYVTLSASAADTAAENHLILHPRILHAGTGCRKGVSGNKITAHLLAVLQEHDLPAAALRSLSSVEAKQHEQGILDCAAELRLPLHFYPAHTLAAVPVPNPSDKPLNAVGTPSVAEAAAITAATCYSQDISDPLPAESRTDQPAPDAHKAAAGGFSPKASFCTTAAGAPHGSPSRNSAMLIITKKADGNVTAAVAQEKTD
ncbi:cobalt-precorrin 5A hydrolase [Oleidesulfovibrio sp.]|uniref:cobalt-precorrin 5A hydrolase n=1 Tax=Oleidesulfovibrio sp. TaxID=2909707 RepID=UPI003A8C6AE6